MVKNLMKLKQIISITISVVRDQVGRAEKAIAINALGLCLLGVGLFLKEVIKLQNLRC